MRKILCIGDSLALPGHLNKYEDTWYYRLKKVNFDCDFTTFFKRSLTTNVLVEMGGGAGGIDNMPQGADCLEFYEPDIVIIQLGIVDCAPRLLNRLDNFVIKVLPKKIINSYIKFIKKIRSRKKNNTLVSFDDFKNNLNNYIERVKRLNAKVIFIGISIPDERVVRKNNFIAENAIRYNQYYNELAKKNNFVRVTKPLNKDDYLEDIYEDGYHPNKKGHFEIYHKLKQILIEFN